MISFNNNQQKKEFKQYFFGIRKKYEVFNKQQLFSIIFVWLPRKKIRNNGQINDKFENYLILEKI